jgi:hypothetical protein
MKVALVSVVMVAACSSSPRHEPSEVAPFVSPITVEPIDVPPPGAPFAGPLTVELVMSANDSVHLFEAWDSSLAQLEAKLGPPTKIIGDKLAWAAMRGDDCADFAIEREDGAHYQTRGIVIGTIHAPQTFGSEAANFARADCLELAGVGIAAEDPDAPAPKSIETIDDIVANAVRGRSKWVGQRIALAAKVVQTGTMVMIGDSNHALTIEMKSGVPYPALRARVKLHCTVKLDRWLGDDSTPSLEPALADCEI